MLSVMVVSRDSRFLDCVGDALQSEGIWVVCIQSISTVMQVLQRGYRPRAVIVDPSAVLEPGGDVLARYFAEYPELADLPILSVSSAAKRIEVAEVVGRLRGLEQASERVPTPE